MENNIEPLFITEGFGSIKIVILRLKIKKSGKKGVKGCLYDLSTLLHFLRIVLCENFATPKNWQFRPKIRDHFSQNSSEFLSSKINCIWSVRRTTSSLPPLSMDVPFRRRDKDILRHPHTRSGQLFPLGGLLYCMG